MQIAQFILLLAIILIGSSVILSGLRGAVWVPAVAKDMDAALNELKIKQGTHVYEFGCGDGRFLRRAAASGAHATGYEINIFLWFVAWAFAGGKRIDVKLGDAWKQPFNDADVTFAFIMPKFMDRLGEKLTTEMKQGSIIVTYAFPIPNKKHYLFKNNCYFYRVTLGR